LIKTNTLLQSHPARDRHCD